MLNTKSVKIFGLTASMVFLVTIQTSYGDTLEGTSIHPKEVYDIINKSDLSKCSLKVSLGKPDWDTDNRWLEISNNKKQALIFASFTDIAGVTHSDCQWAPQDKVGVGVKPVIKCYSNQDGCKEGLLGETCWDAYSELTINLDSQGNMTLLAGSHFRKNRSKKNYKQTIAISCNLKSN